MGGPVTKLIVLIVLSIAVFTAARGLIRCDEKEKIRRAKQEDQAKINATLDAM